MLLAYAGAEGSERSYDLEQIFRGRFAIQGVPQLAVVKFKVHLRETVERVAPDGRRIIRTVYEFSPPEINGMPMNIFDIPESLEVLFLRSPSGEVEQLGMDLAAPGFLGLVIRSLGILFPRLPSGPVEPGEAWARSTRIPVADGSSEFVVTTQESFGGMVPGVDAPGGTAIVETEGSIRFTEPLKCTALCRFELDYTGEAEFSVSEGAPVASRQKGMVKMKSRANGIYMEARMQFSSVLTRSD